MLLKRITNYLNYKLYIRLAYVGICPIGTYASLGMAHEPIISLSVGLLASISQILELLLKICFNSWPGSMIAHPNAMDDALPGYIAVTPRQYLFVLQRIKDDALNLELLLFIKKALSQFQCSV
ncbi:hypothetical protein BT96DRAFT_947560 [Gymnopus androsaceus JB14]|uniref:Uncharacterized protein n=1 Tax=Gymnopus androsaceus JB14 TaxID=1447944 RepID=A0A6A4GT77_9AGAR|nr:hypothetical protein BT96DRAFT_947560 [Gymnopus androsaceus JB14]